MTSSTNDPFIGNGEAGEWTFFTTAAEDGTINVPWRYTGFHAFFQVRVRLNAIVLRDGDDSISDVSLVDAGPANCCGAPSSGFDYSGVAQFEVEAGDVYGFRLFGSNGDSNETLTGELLLGNDVPIDCADARDLYDSTEDGRYVILPVDGQRFSVHCSDMNDSPTEYLTLARTGPGINTGSYAAGGAADGTTVTTTFLKVRLDPATLTVDIGDLSFASSPGSSLTHPDDGGDQIVTSMPYGVAMACSDGEGPDGLANIDLQGTPFAVDDTFTPVGTNSASHGGAVFSALDQVVNITANGFCGWRTPYPPAEGGEFFVFNPTTGENGLTLRYLTEAPDDLATPVLFASVSTTATTADVFGIVDGSDNDNLGFEVFRGSSCTDGVLGSPVAVPGPISATTDAGGLLPHRRTSRRSHWELRRGSRHEPDCDGHLGVRSHLGRQRLLAQGPGAIHQLDPGRHRYPGHGALVQVRGHPRPAHRDQAVRAARGLRPGRLQGHRHDLPGPARPGGRRRPDRAQRGIRAVGLLAVGVQPERVLAVGLQPGRVQPVGLLAVGLQPERVLAVGLQPVGLQPVGLLAVGLQPERVLAVGLLAVGLQPVGLPPVGLLAVGVQRRGRRPGVLERPDPQHHRRVGHAGRR